MPKFRFCVFFSEPLSLPYKCYFTMPLQWPGHFGPDYSMPGPILPGSVLPGCDFCPGKFLARVHFARV